ncbi:MAG: AAA family ATPase [Gemmatimonadaceae bacterium]
MSHAIALYASNIKRLTAVRIDFTGGVVQITGKNDQGKSSVLDAIIWALGGKARIQFKPIRAGEESAVIQLKVGKFLVTRTFKTDEQGDYTTSLRVEDAETGARHPRAQEILDRLLAGIAFDPLEFARAEPRRRLEMLKRFIPNFDFATHEAERARDFEERTAINRDVKKMEAQLAGFTITQEVPEPKIETRSLEEQIEASRVENVKIQERIQARAALRTKMATWEEARTRALAEAAALRHRAGEIEAAAQVYKNQLDEAKARFEEKPEEPQLIDASAIAARLEDARNARAAYESYKAKVEARNKYAAELEDMKKSSIDLTKAIEARDERKRQAIAEAKLPFPGLEPTVDDVLLNGVTIDQASSAQKIQAGTALAFAGEPELRLCLIHDGSLLDEDAMRALEAEAKARDFQVIIERVSPSEVGSVVVIEDGHVKGQEAAMPLAAPRREPEEMPPARTTPTRPAPAPAQTPAGVENLFEGEL